MSVQMKAKEQSREEKKKEKNCLHNRQPVIFTSCVITGNIFSPGKMGG
jgi:hypothetical protein